MTKRRMFLRMVLSSILRRRSRVLIAMLAVAIGATTLSSLAMIAIDVPRQMAREMRSYGANVVVLPSGDKADFAPGTLEAIRRDIPADKFVGAVGFNYQPITINDLPYVAAGTDMAAVKAINPFWYVEGAWPTQPGQVLIGREIARATDVAVGDTLNLNQMIDVKQGGHTGNKEAAFPGHEHSDPVAKNPTTDNTTGLSEKTGASHAQPSASPATNGVKGGTDASPSNDAKARKLGVTISGILETGGPEDGFVYLAADDLHQLTGRPHALTVAELSIAAQEGSLDQIAAKISADHKNVKAAPVARLKHSDANVLEMLRSLMMIITVIVLALITIGVSTTMMAVVTERRNEIGLRKALGADNRSIVGEFLGEAVVLGFLGGIAGAILGYGLAQVISFNVFHRTVGFQPLVILATIIVSVVVSTLASLIPVRRAIDVDPAIVLRGE